MPTVRDIAKIAGVSPSTVSRVLNDRQSVDDELRNRVMAAAAELQYSIKPARQPAAPPLQVGIIVAKTSGQSMQAHPGIYTVITSFIHILDQQGISNSLLLIEDKDAANIEAYFAKRLDGYLIIGTSAIQEDALVGYFQQTKIPYVIINRWMNKRHVNYVNTDDITAAYAATMRLIQLGHRKIAYIGGEKQFRHSELRLAGYRNAMQQSGLETPDRYIFQGEYSEQYGHTAGEALLAMEDRPTAAFTAGDTLAIGLQSAFLDHGLKLPQDLAIVTFGNVSAPSYARPRLTAIDIPYGSMGVQAAQALIMQIQSKDIAGIQILMDAPLVIRESCGQPVKA